MAQESAPSRIRQGSVLDLPPEERPADGTEYKAPEAVSVEELLKKDQEDESLQRYKKALLGSDPSAKADASDPRQVILQGFTVVLTDKAPVEMNLADPDLVSKPYSIKEGAGFRLKFKFIVQHQPVLGLKFHNVVYRLKIKVDSQTYMVGSYAARPEPYDFVTAEEEAPSGMLSRGHYEAVGRFVDDDHKIHAEFRYSFDIQKE